MLTVSQAISPNRARGKGGDDFSGKIAAPPARSSRAAGKLAARDKACQHACMNGTQRWIMHVDMDAFYASIEQMDHPELRGKPVIVGGSGGRAVVSAASYEARAFGVRSAMPLSVALRRCPRGVRMPVRMERYKEVSRQVMAVLRRYSPRVEQASVDEAYLDASGLERLFGPVDALARAIKADVAEAVGGLTCSVGVAPVKFLAKIASEMRKPNGLFILRPEETAAFLAELAVERIPGVGRHFLEALHALGVRRGKDVLRYPEDFWQRRFGKAGVQLLERSQGIDPREVEPFAPPKSESAETTFSEDTRDPAVLRRWLFRHADRVGRSLRKQKLCGRVVTLKIKYADFRQITRQTTLPLPTCATQTIYEAALALLESVRLENRVRLVGVGVSAFDATPHQLSLAPGVTPEETEERRARLDRTLDALNERFGKRIVTCGRLLDKE